MANNLTSGNQVAQLLNNIKAVIEQARMQVKQTVNSAMVQAYRHIGQLIVEDE